LSQLQAAVLVPQIHELPERNSIRQVSVEHLAGDILKRCSNLNRPGFETESAWYKLPFLIDSGLERETVISRLKAEGVPVNVGFNGFVKRTARRCRKVGDLANASRAASDTILLHHPVLLESAETREQVVSAFKKVMNSFD
jgi:dTDP-4-amino-4,6-dideoxygalactose transaminase